MAWDEILNQGIQNFSPQNVALTDLYGAQAKGADIANQKAQLGLDFEKSLASGLTGPGAQASGVGAPSSETPLDLNTGAARQHVFQNYSPLPDVWTPQEQQQRAYAAMSGVPGAVDAVTAMHTQRITSQNAARNKAAQQQYNDLYGVATAPEGQAWDMFKLAEESTPEGKREVARLEQQGLTDDDFIRKHAAALAGITHSVAQLPKEYRADGVVVDQTTGQEVPGYNDAVGLSAKDRSELVKAAMTQVDVNTPEGGTKKVPQYQADGAPSMEAWVDRATRQSNNRAPTVANPGPGAAAPAPGTAPAPGAPSPAPAVAAAPPAAMPPPAVRRPMPPPGVPTAGAPPAPGAPPARPGFGNPLAPSANNGGKPLDFSDIPPGYSTRGRAPGTMGPGESAQATGAAEDLRAANKQASLNLGNANYEITEAKQILSILPQAGVGPGSGLTAKLQTALQGLFGNSKTMTQLLGDPGARQMLEKLLGQDAIASTEKEMKENGGGSIRGGAQLANLAIGKLNASPEMARSAISAIVNYQMQQAQYDRQKWGQDFAAYRVKGGDPNSFGDWYDAKYPLQNAVKPLAVNPAVTQTRPSVLSQEQYDALPKGASYTFNGKLHVKGGQ